MRGACEQQPLYVEALIRRLYPWLAVRYGSGAVRGALVGLLCELVAPRGRDVPEVVAAAVQVGAPGGGCGLAYLCLLGAPSTGGGKVLEVMAAAVQVGALDRG